MVLLVFSHGVLVPGVLLQPPLERADIVHQHRQLHLQVPGAAVAAVASAAVESATAHLAVAASTSTTSDASTSCSFTSCLAATVCLVSAVRT